MDNQGEKWFAGCRSLVDEDYGSSGEEDVGYVKRCQVDILVLDMIMAPGIDGLETYQRILGIHPKQKAILVSGFSETDRVRKAQKLGAGAYVKKPYVMETAWPSGMNWDNVYGNTKSSGSNPAAYDNPSNFLAGSYKREVRQ